MGREAVARAEAAVASRQKKPAAKPTARPAAVAAPRFKFVSSAEFAAAGLGLADLESALQDVAATARDDAERVNRDRAVGAAGGAE